MQLKQKYIVIYFVLSLLNVKNVMNEKDVLKNCVNKVLQEFQISNEADSNLLSLIDESSLILKAFASKQLVDSFDLNKNEECCKNVNNDFSTHNNDTKQNAKVLIAISPVTIYKGVNVFRKLKLFINNKQYLKIDG